MDIKNQKKELRKIQFENRRDLNAEIKHRYDTFICDQLFLTIIQHNYRVVHAYIPIAFEIDIKPLLEKLLAQQITVVCPKTLPNRRLENRQLLSFESLEVGIMGTLHPKTEPPYTGAYDLIVVPGLAFDRQNYRLGYGGGYYDTFLAQHKSSKKIGIFYPFQQVQTVPIEPHDYPLDEILYRDF